jgi:glutaconate CoA-transferase subunit B
LVLTSKAILGWDNAAKEWVLHYVHPGSSVEDVKSNTGFDLRLSPSLQSTPPPAVKELHILRTIVREKLGQIYPDFARDRIRSA